MGGQWDNTRPITYSVAPDGADWDRGINNINSTLNASLAGSNWQKSLATALQTWAASANLNFVPVADGGAGFNVSGQSQGDPRFGDIRLAGYSFTTKTIAQTYGPPPNGATGGGEVKLNTSYDFGPNGQWDLESVLIHEVGHSLGLGESPQTDAAMYGYYSGVRQSLSGSDIEGIQSIYGPRLADVFQSKGMAVSPSTAVDVSVGLNSSGLNVVNNLSLPSIGASEYFSVTAPMTRGATLQVNAVAFGHSLLSPQVAVIDAATGATLAVDAHPDQFGNNALVTIPNVQPGHRYLIVVTGATRDVFSVGNYSLRVSFAGGTGSAATPVVTAPPVPVAIPAPPVAVPVATPPPVTVAPVPIGLPGMANAASDPYSAATSFASAAELGSITGHRLITNVSLRSGQDLRVFAFSPARAGLVFLASANATILVGDANGRPVVSGRGLIGFVAPQAGARYYVVVLSPNNTAVANASFAVEVVPTVVATPTVPTPNTVNPPTPAATKSVTIRKKPKRRRR